MEMVSEKFLEAARKPKGKDISGERFGRLVAVERVGLDKKRNALWRCKCECGGETIRAVSELNKRNNHSCGCLGKENLKKMSNNNITHGMTGTRLYGCYKGMMSRCYRVKDVHYNAYGKRGIIVCDEWKNNAKAFVEWALSNGYADDLTIERINVNGNYEPSNCTWIPLKDQYKNKQSNCQQPLPSPYEGSI
jgi:hypothetical protein